MKQKIRFMDLSRYETVLTFSPEHKVYTSVNPKYPSIPLAGYGPVLDKNENKSRVENTLTTDCFLNAFSCAHIGQSSFNANAKYSTSFKCGANSLASGILAKNRSRGMNPTLNLRMPTKASKSLRENPDFSLISS
jgi:hypothetical protein